MLCGDSGFSAALTERQQQHLVTITTATPSFIAGTLFNKLCMRGFAYRADAEDQSWASRIILPKGRS